MKNHELGVRDLQGWCAHSLDPTRRTSDVGRLPTESFLELFYEMGPSLCVISSSAQASVELVEVGVDGDWLLGGHGVGG